MSASQIPAHHFNRYTHGGAAIAAIRIARAVAGEGCPVSFWHKKGESRASLASFGGGSPWRADPPWGTYASRWTRHLWLRLQHRVPFFSPPWFYDQPLFHPERYGDGVLHLHWLGSDLLDQEAFFNSIPAGHPIIWTLHDINPLTGGCHLAGDCRGFTRQCGNCPLLGGGKENDVSRRAMEIKLRVLRNKNLHFVAPSHWMAERIQASSVGQLAKTIRVIHNPLDTEAFSPMPREEAKRQLGIDPAKPVIAFGASILNEAHKGIYHLVQALLKLKESTQFQLLVFGSGMPGALAKSGLPCRYVGFISEQSRQRLLYSATDALVLPSLEESSGQVGTEAMACGTPVVAFRTGGIPDYVKHGETGFLAERGNVDGLAMQLQNALSDLPRLRLLGANARKTAVELFEERQQARKYVALYEEARKA